MEFITTASITTQKVICTFNYQTTPKDGKCGLYSHLTFQGILHSHNKHFSYWIVFDWYKLHLLATRMKDPAGSFTTRSSVSLIGHILQLEVLYLCI